MKASAQGVLAILVLLAALAVSHRGAAEAGTPAIAVQLQGTGWVRLQEPTLGALARAHGLDCEGDQVLVDGQGVAPDCRVMEPVASLVLTGRLDLNRADAQELQGLPGIGPSLSARIVEDRAQRGPYGSVEELERVRGIGPSRRGAVQAYVLVVEPPGPCEPEPAGQPFGDPCVAPSVSLSP